MPATVEDLLQSDSEAYLNQEEYYVENGMAPDPATVRANILGDATAFCNPASWGGDAGNRCPNGVPTAEIDSIVAAYSAALGSDAALAASGAIAVPITPQQVSSLYGAYYSPNSGMAAPSNVIPPEPTPTSPAFTSPSNVAVTAQATQVAGTSGGVGPTQGGSTTLQTNLNPGPDAASAINFLGTGSNMKVLLILAAIFILVLLVGRG